MAEQLPPAAEHVRTTDEFDHHTVPAALRRAHRIAPGVWGVLAVRDGSIRFVFDERPGDGRVVRSGQRHVIPPDEPHHLEVIGPVRLVIEFHRTHEPVPS